MNMKTMWLATVISVAMTAVACGGGGGSSDESTDTGNQSGNTSYVNFTDNGKDYGEVVLAAGNTFMRVNSRSRNLEYYDQSLQQNVKSPSITLGENSKVLDGDKIVAQIALVQDDLFGAIPGLVSETGPVLMQVTFDPVSGKLGLVDSTETVTSPGSGSGSGSGGSGGTCSQSYAGPLDDPQFHTFCQQAYSFTCIGDLVNARATADRKSVV